MRTILLDRRAILSLCVALSVPITTVASLGQTAPSGHSASGKNEAGEGASREEFDVFSIRPSKPDDSGTGTRILPNGYSSANSVLAISIKMAYLPHDLWYPDRVEGVPPWMAKNRYTIVGKIAPEYLAAWQKQTMNYKAMLEQMLQVALAERCNLTLHRVPIQVDGYALVLAKRGPQLSIAKPDEKLPVGGQQLQDGGKIVGFAKGSQQQQVTFFGVSMDALAKYLGQSSPGHPVEDDTGLSGKYDFVLQRAESGGTGAVPMEENPAYIWNLGALGLKILRTRVMTEKMVIDHIDPPSAN